jgi:hypothetical protein
VGVSIYYTARRSVALSQSEQDAVREIVSRYSVNEQIEQYLQTEKGWSGEDFCLYCPPLDSPDMILDGATKLPREEETLSSAIQHWCRVLSELRCLLSDAEWRVHVDDFDVHWDHARHVFDPFA